MPVDWFVVICPLIIVTMMIIGSLFRTYRKSALKVATAFSIVYLLIYVGPFVWYRIGAANGDVDSQYELGLWYLGRFGNNLPDKASGMYWMLKAAENGHPRAMVNTGHSYLLKSIIEASGEDIRNAKHWFRLAEKAGQYDAKRVLDDIENRRGVGTIDQGPLQLDRFRDAEITGISKEDLAKTIASDNLTVSFMAEWELVSRSRDNPTEWKHACSDFCKFIKEKTSCNPPAWWINGMATCTITPSPMKASIYVGESDLTSSEFTYTANYDQITKDISIDTEGAETIFRNEAESIAVPSSMIPERGFRNKSALMQNPTVYFANYSFGSQPYTLFAYNSVTHKDWKADVWGGGGLINLEMGFMRHYVQIMSNRTSIIIFGMNRSSLYIEGFGKDNGSPLFRFSTGYLGSMDNPE